MPNHRVNCPYCKVDVLNRIIGSHILKNHKNQLFADKQNLRALHNEKNLKKPLALFIDDDTYYFCLADSSCIKKEILADNHFKGKADSHREAILKLREDFPVSGEQPELPQSSAPLLTAKELSWLQELIMDVVASKDVALTSHCRSAFKKLNLKVEEDDLKKIFPDHEYFVTNEEQEEEQEEEEDESKEETESVREEPEPLPLVLPKPMTKEEVFKHLMTEKDIKAMTTSIVSGKTIEVAEIQQLRKPTVIPRPSDLELLQASKQQEVPPLKILTTTKRIAKQV